jgi:quercetin dioxygenase-like cupin family protein
MKHAHRGRFLPSAALLWLCTLAGSAAAAEQSAGVRLATLLRAELEVVDGLDVIVSMVEIPPGESLPSHYHPGEEFIYVLEGSGLMRQEGADDVRLGPGDVFKVPLEQVHWAETGEEGVKALVFRVHKQGEPERVPVDR